MSRQNAVKYVLPVAPVAAVLLLALLAAWAFKLPPVAALTGQDTPAATINTTLPTEQTAGYPYDVIQISGTGTATAKPDLAILSLGVSVTATTVAEARTQAATSMKAVLDALAANGVATADIQTTRFDVYADYEYDYDQDRRIFLGYVVSNGVNVTVRKIDSLGAVIDAAIAAGGNDIEFDWLDYGFSDSAALERKARKAAVADMQDKAGQLAEFSGRQLGNLKVISETPVADVFGSVREFAALAADSTPIMVGEEEISVTIHGVYELR